MLDHFPQKKNPTLSCKHEPSQLTYCWERLSSQAVFLVNNVDDWGLLNEVFFFYFGNRTRKFCLRRATIACDSLLRFGLSCCFVPQEVVTVVVLISSLCVKVHQSQTHSDLLSWRLFPVKSMYFTPNFGCFGCWCERVCTHHATGSTPHVLITFQGCWLSWRSQQANISPLYTLQRQMSVFRFVARFPFFLWPILSPFQILAASCVCVCVHACLSVFGVCVCFIIVNLNWFLSLFIFIFL